MYNNDKKFEIVGAGGASGGGAVNVGMAKSVSPVEREIEQLSKATGELNIVAEDLQKRLSSVLRSQPESRDEGVPIEPLTALPSAIRYQKDSVSRAVYLLKSILSRLEL